MAEKQNKLSPMRQRFVNEYLKDLNATQAAIRAGYSEKTAYSQGQRLLKKVEVKAAVDAAIARRNKRLEVDQDKVIRELAKVALADIKDYLTYRTAITQVGVDDEGKPIFDYAPIIELTPSEDVDGTVIQEVSLSQKGVFSFKLQDKLKALELLGRHLGLFTDNVNLSGEVGVKVVDDIE
jgi:phage terminase small subunit